MNRVRKVAVALGVLILAGGLTGASAEPEEVTWSSSGCTPSGDQSLGASGVSEDGVLLTLPLEVRRTVETDPLVPLLPPDALDGDLNITVQPLPGHREQEPWTQYEGLGFAMPAMEGDPDPFEAGANVVVRRNTETSSESGGTTLVYRPDPAEASIDEFDPPYGAYAILDAEFAINNDDGEAWCVVEASGSAEQPVAEFEIHPPQEDVDAEISAMEQAAEEERRQESYVLLLQSVGVLAVGGVLVAVAVVLTRLLRRRRPHRILGGPPPSQPTGSEET